MQPDNYRYNDSNVSTSDQGIPGGILDAIRKAKAAKSQQNNGVVAGKSLYPNANYQNTFDAGAALSGLPQNPYSNVPQIDTNPSKTTAGSIAKTVGGIAKNFGPIGQGIGTAVDLIGGAINFADSRKKQRAADNAETSYLNSQYNTAGIAERNAADTRNNTLNYSALNAANQNTAQNNRTSLANLNNSGLSQGAKLANAGQANLNSSNQEAANKQVFNKNAQQQSANAGQQELQGSNIRGQAQQQNAQYQKQRAIAATNNANALIGSGISSLDNIGQAGQIAGMTSAGGGAGGLGALAGAFSKGGEVPGHGMGDKVPAMLEPKEKIISNADQHYILIGDGKNKSKTDAAIGKRYREVMGKYERERQMAQQRDAENSPEDMQQDMQSGEDTPADNHADMSMMGDLAKHFADGGSVPDPPVHQPTALEKFNAGNKDYLHTNNNVQASDNTQIQQPAYIHNPNQNYGVNQAQLAIAKNAKAAEIAKNATRANNAKLSVADSFVNPIRNFAESTGNQIAQIPKYAAQGLTEIGHESGILNDAAYKNVKGAINDGYDKFNKASEDFHNQHKEFDPTVSNYSNPLDYLKFGGHIAGTAAPYLAPGLGEFDAEQAGAKLGRGLSNVSSKALYNPELESAIARASANRGELNALKTANQSYKIPASIGESELGQYQNVADRIKSRQPVSTTPQPPATKSGYDLYDQFQNKLSNTKDLNEKGKLIDNFAKESRAAADNSQLNHMYSDSQREYMNRKYPNMTMDDAKQLAEQHLNNKYRQTAGFSFDTGKYKNPELPEWATNGVKEDRHLTMEKELGRPLTEKELITDKLIHNASKSNVGNVDYIPMNQEAKELHTPRYGLVDRLERAGATKEELATAMRNKIKNGGAAVAGAGLGAVGLKSGTFGKPNPIPKQNHAALKNTIAAAKSKKK